MQVTSPGFVPSVVDSLSSMIVVVVLDVVIAVEVVVEGVSTTTLNFSAALYPLPRDPP